MAAPQVAAHQQALAQHMDVLGLLGVVAVGVAVVGQQALHRLELLTVDNGGPHGGHHHLPAVALVHQLLGDVDAVLEDACRSCSRNSRPSCSFSRRDEYRLVR